MGRSGYEGGDRRLYIYISLHCHHQNDSCIKKGSDESHFNVSLIVRTKSQDSVHRTQLLKRRAEAVSNQVPLLPLTARPNRLTGVQDGHLDFLTAPELCFRLSIAWQLLILHSCSFLLKYIITA